MTSFAHAKQASSGDASFSQPGLFVSLSGNRSVSCQTSIPRQRSKAVITNEILPMKLNLTMWSDQCVAQS